MNVTFLLPAMFAPAFKGGRNACISYVFFGFMLLLVSVRLSAAEVRPITVAFLNPADKGDVYWDRYVDYMQVAAESLGITLQVHYARENRIHGTRLVEQLLNGEHVPNYLVYIYQQGATHRILQIAESKGVKSLIVNTNIAQSDVERVGLPREKYKGWIGHIHPQNVEAGEQLADALWQRKSKLADHSSQDSAVSSLMHSELSIIGLSGSRDSSAGLDYNTGLKNSVARHPDLSLQQLVFTDWNREKAKYQTIGLLERYPGVSLVWSIGEDIAFGILDALASTGKTPGKDVVVGGTVSSAEGVKAVKAGLLVANMGGDSWEGAHALVTLYDYHHGHDVTAKDYTIRYKTEVVSAANVDPYVELIVNQKWQWIDYSRLTFTHTGKEIPFDVQALLNAVKAPKARAHGQHVK